MFQPSLLKNVCWKEFGLLAFVWLAFLALQIANVSISMLQPYLAFTGIDPT